MLTHTEEHGKQKCTQYWPSDICENEAQEGLIFDSKKEVRLVSVDLLIPNLIKRKFIIKTKDSKSPSSEVTQLQYLSWPDHGAPEEEDFTILRTILDYMKEHH